LLQSTRLAPDGRRCPECRAQIEIKDPAGHPINEELALRIRQVVPAAVLEDREAGDSKQLGAFLAREMQNIPVFYMRGVESQPGESVCLHLFEPRYKILIRRAWEGNKRFLCVQHVPREGDIGLLVQVDEADFLSDGRANVHGRGVERVTLTRAWVEEGTEGLYYAEVGGAAPQAVPPAGGSSRRAGGSADARVKETLRMAIRQGVPEYNSGRVARCAEIYTEVAERLVGELGTEREATARLRRGLQEANEAGRRGDTDQVAWVLRHAFDEVLALPPDASPASDAGLFVQDRELPVFFMRGWLGRGETVQWRFFEPRYRILAGETWSSTRKLFLYTASEPQEGNVATMVRMDGCSWDSHGNASVICTCTDTVHLESVREDADKGGLFYACFRMQGSARVQAHGCCSSQ